MIALSSFKKIGFCVDTLISTCTFASFMTITGASLTTIIAVSPVNAQSYDTITFHNRCSHPVQIAVRFMNPSGAWTTEAWYPFEPGEEAHLRGVQSTNQTVYYYAETTDGSDQIWSGNHAIAIGSKTYNMTVFNTGENWGNHTMTLTCGQDTIRLPINGQRRNRVANGHMETNFHLSENGMLNANTHIWTKNEWSGFTGGVFIVLTDGQGHPIWSSAQHRYGVDGTWIGNSDRRERWQEEVPAHVLSKVGGYAIMQGHTPRIRIWDFINSPEGQAAIETAVVIITAL